MSFILKDTSSIYISIRIIHTDRSIDQGLQLVSTTVEDPSLKARRFAFDTSSILVSLALEVYIYISSIRRRGISKKNFPPDRLALYSNRKSLKTNIRASTTSFASIRCFQKHRFKHPSQPTSSAPTVVPDPATTRPPRQQLYWKFFHTTPWNFLENSTGSVGSI